MSATPAAPATAPKAIGFLGDSGSGKTTLIVQLIARFARTGLRVAAVKHAHHGFDVDKPGKDSYRYREAGATQVLVASERRWALLSEEGVDPAAEGMLARQVARFDPCDLVLVEGFRAQSAIPFIHVRRKPPEREAGAVRVVAVASDERLHDPMPGGIPVLDLNDIDAIAKFIAAELQVPFC
jgi:molybdopterin-guanine dinucleotide biosynthesis adapter protein